MTQEELEELEASSTSTSGVIKLQDLVKHESGRAAVSKTNAVFVEETLKFLDAGTGIQGGEGEGRSECPLCLDMMEAPVLIPPCMHQWYINGFVLVKLRG